MLRLPEEELLEVEEEPVLLLLPADEEALQHMVQVKVAEPPTALLEVKDLEAV